MLQTDTSAANRLKKLRIILRDRASTPKFIAKALTIMKYQDSSKKTLLGQLNFQSMQEEEDYTLTIQAQKLVTERALDWLNTCEDALQFFEVYEFLTNLSGKNNPGILADAAWDSETMKQEQKQMNEANIDIQLWPEIKAMLVTELDILFQRFPCLTLSKQISSACVYLASDLMTKSIENSEAYPLSPARLDEVTQVYHLHKQRNSVDASELSKDIIEGEENSTDDQVTNLRLLESIAVQLAQVQNVDLQYKHFLKNILDKFCRVCGYLRDSFESRGLQNNSQDTTNEVEKDQLDVIARILETIIPQTSVVVILPTEQSDVNSLKLSKQSSSLSSGSAQTNSNLTYRYTDTYFQNMFKSKFKQLYRPFAYGLNVLLTRAQSFRLQMSCLRLLKRFWDLFDNIDQDLVKHRQVLEASFITVLENIALQENIKKHRPAAVMYYYLLNSDNTREQFKQSLKEAKLLEILRFNPHFSTLFDPTQEVEQQSQPLDLSLTNQAVTHQLDNHSAIEELGVAQAGFSVEKNVPNKDSVSEYVNIPVINSLLHFRFTTLEYNIGFSVEKVGQIKLVGGSRQEVNNQAFVRYSLCDSHLKPISKTILITKPGIYKVIWHNKHSFMKSKTVKYRIRVLEPTFDSLSRPEEDLFSLESLTKEQEITFTNLRKVYPDFIPMVRILRPNQPKAVSIDSKGIGFFIENTTKQDGSCDIDNLFVSVFIPNGQQSNSEFEIQMNKDELTSTRLDANAFYSEDSVLTKIYLIDARKQPNHIQKYKQTQESKKELREFVVYLEKVMYLSLAKLNQSIKLNQSAQFIFSDKDEALSIIKLMSTEDSNDMCANLLKLSDAYEILRKGISLEIK